ncbi:N-acetyltransferase [Allomuricauda sp.]|uniref:GNAT family N-acetyltransferase n=1 Tax=Flagellimonas alginolytica TaxID=3177515 RepID=UPI0025D90A5F|nr:N-acetyltransferase [Allomuricauda sp.]
MFNNTNINRLPLVFKSNDGKNYFQFHIRGQLASLEYDMIGEQEINLKKLEISKHLNRPEVGNALIERVLEYSLRADYTVVPTNPEVVKFIQKRPEYKKLLSVNNSSIDFHQKKFREHKTLF